MAQKQLVIEISPTGDTKVDAQGFKGNECDKVAEHIEVALGGVQSKKKKPEYFAPAGNSQANKLTF
jgi:hypothetical protein